MLHFVWDDTLHINFLSQTVLFHGSPRLPGFLGWRTGSSWLFHNLSQQGCPRVVPSRSQGQWCITISFLLIELFHQKVLVAGMRGLLQDLEGTCLSCVRLEVSRTWMSVTGRNRWSTAAVCTDLPTTVASRTSKDHFQERTEKSQNKENWFCILSVMQFLYFVIMDVPVAKLMLRLQSWEQTLKSGSGSESGIECSWCSDWKISSNPAFSKCVSSWSSKLWLVA